MSAYLDEFKRLDAVVKHTQEGSTIYDDFAKNVKRALETIAAQDEEVTQRQVQACKTMLSGMRVWSLVPCLEEGHCK